MPSLISEKVTQGFSALYIDRTYQGWPEIAKQIEEFAHRNRITTRTFKIDPQLIQHLARIVDADSIEVEICIEPDIGRYRQFGFSVQAKQSEERPNREYAYISLYATAPEKDRNISRTRMIAGFEELDEQSLQKAKWYMQKLFSIAYKAVRFMDQSYQPEIDISDLFEEEDREQKKDTDEVQPADSMDSDAVHGGTSNSAEVNSQAAKPKQNNNAERQQQQSQQSSGIQAQQDTQKQDSQGEKQDQQDKQSDADKHGESQKKDADKHEADKQGAAEQKDDKDSEKGQTKKPEQNKQKHGSKPSSFKQMAKQSKAIKTDMKPVRQFGGYFRQNTDRSVIAKRYAIRFNRILNKLAGETKEGPRWKYSKVAQKILSFRTPKVQDRRLEAGRPAIMFLLDFSASMGSFVGQSSLLIDAATQLGTEAKVIVVATSNGYPQELYIDTKKVKEFGYFGSDEQVRQEYAQIISKHNVRIVVCFADSDGAWIYEKIAEMVDRFYWLHNFRCSYGRIQKVAPDKDWSRKAKNNTVMYIGVGSVDQVIEALEDAIK